MVRTRPILLALLVLAGGLRLGWGLAQGGKVDERLGDQGEYLQLGRNLLARHSLWFRDARFDDDVRAYRMPGYPAFVAVCGADVRVVRVVQALVDTATVLAAYLLARRWLGQGWSLVAAAGVALNPFLVYFSALILSETLFTAMLAWGMVLLVWRRNLLAGGLLLALATLVRPSALLLNVVLGLAAAFAHHRDGARASALPRVPIASSMLLLAVLTLLPWAWRNHRVLDQWIWLTTNAGVTRYDGFNPDATGGSDQRFLQSAEMTGLKRLGEVSRDQVLTERANEWIRKTWHEDPRRLADLTVSKVARTWSPLPLSEDYGGRPGYRVAALVYTTPLYLLTVAGLWLAALPRPAKALLLAPAAYFTVVHALSVGSLRYLVPAHVPMAVMAAAAIPGLVAMIRPGEWRRNL